MNNIYYAIASYHRPKCKTYHALKECGIEDERIVVCLNDSNDYKAYRQNLGSRARIILREGIYVSFNRNTCLNQFEDGSKILLLDDDIRSFQKWHECSETKCGRLINLTNNFEREVKKIFDFMQKNGINYAGVISTDNKMNISKLNRTGEQYSYNTLLQGGFNFIIKNNKIAYDEKMKILDDYELCLRLIRQGQIIARNNTIIANKARMGKEKGGYYEIYKTTNLQKQYLNLLKRKYDDMVTIRGNSLIIKRKWRI